MNIEDKKVIIKERIKEIGFKIDNITNKISMAEQSESEYSSKLDGYNILLNNYILIKQELEAILEDMI